MRWTNSYKQNMILNKKKDKNSNIHYIRKRQKNWQWNNICPLKRASRQRLQMYLVPSVFVPWNIRGAWKSLAISLCQSYSLFSSFWRMLWQMRFSLSIRLIIAFSFFGCWVIKFLKTKKRSKNLFLRKQNPSDQNTNANTFSRFHIIISWLQNLFKTRIFFFIRLFLGVILYF